MSTIIRLLAQFKNLGKLFILTSIIIMLTGFSKTLLGIQISNLIDGAIYGNTGTGSLTILYIFLALTIYLVLNALGKKQFGRLLFLGEKDLFSQNIDRMVKARYAHIQNFQPGEFLNRFSEDCSEFINAMSNLLQKSLSTSLQMIIVLAILAFICWPLALFAFFLPIIYNSWFLWFSERIQPVNRTEREQMGALTAYFVDCLMGRIEARVFNTAKHMGEHSRSLLLDRDKSERKKAKFWSLVSMSDSLMSNLYLLSIIVLGIFMVEYNWISWGKILLFLTMAPTFLNFIWDVDPQSFRRAIVAAERVQWLWDLPLERSDGSKFPCQENEPIIECEKLDFAYPDTPEQILKDINFVIPKGKSVAIIGENGSGKTTLLNLLCALIEGYRGELRFAGYSMEEWNPQALHEEICYMRQSSTVYDDSLLFNVTLGKNFETSVTEQETRAHNILDQVGLLYLSETPEKLNRQIKTLSDGERQRIALARCIYKDAPLWVLDEPTSALDPVTEELIAAYIRKIHALGKTVIVVSHRMAVIKGFDSIYTIEGGRLKEHGTDEKVSAIGQ